MPIVCGGDIQDPTVLPGRAGRPRRLRRLLHRRRQLDLVGGGQELHGRGPVWDFLIWMHTQAFNARPKVKTLVIGDGQAALEADFVGTHTGEFLGMPASGKSVQLPYCVVYDLQHDKIAALRAYIPMDLFAQQLQ